ncbi:piggyBac transposable element-derived protein 4-like [Lytechinus pictus]|uniref:piggyBac transposable element-derived protein 4-like n=1 Tax=Lytechinus pictus TaxID=7653 RepID=UPI00240DDBC3|nr:piggyBac transposable element-derived protein 4-like [Lytechinus pictus]
MAPPRKRRKIDTFTADEVRDILMDSDWEIEDPRDDSVDRWSDEEDMNTSDDTNITFHDDPSHPSENEENSVNTSADNVPGPTDAHPSDVDQPATGPALVQQTGPSLTRTTPIWTRLAECDNFTPSRAPVDGRARLKFDFTDFTPVDFFYQFYPRSIFEHITEETNRYASQFFDCPDPVLSGSRYNAWSDTDESEMRAFTALQIAMGLVKKPAVANYWETISGVLATPGFGEVMPRNRFQLLNGFLHFNNNERIITRGNPGFDPMFKTRPLIDKSVPQYMDSYEPSCHLSVDESLVPFKGRLAYKQYIPNKPKKWGIKMWVLCDAETGFCLKWLPYTGAEIVPRGASDSISERIVKRLVEPYFGTDRAVYCDNFYTSVGLLQDLAAKDMGVCGTVRSNRRGLPDDVRNGQLHLKKGDDPVYYRSNDDMLLVSWHDTKRVNVLSTIDDNTVIKKSVRSRHHQGGRREIKKPSAVISYNAYMNGVDRLDQRMSYCKFPHKKRKAYRVIYHFLMEVALVNAQICHKLANPTSKLTTREFRSSIISGLLSGHNPTRYRRPRVPPPVSEARLEEKHFLDEYPRGHRRDCFVCSVRPHRRKTTSTYCIECNKAMCIKCFRRYHTLKNY